MAATISNEVVGGGAMTRPRPWGPMVAATLATALFVWASSHVVRTLIPPDDLPRLEGDIAAVDAPSGPRAHTTTVPLGDGRVLVWGGVNAQPGTGGVYDPATEVWQPLPDPPGPVRVGATGVWTGEEVVIAGGVNAGAGPQLGAAAWSPATGEWREIPAAPFEMAYARGVALAGGVLFAGGDVRPDRPTALWFDLASGEWSPVALPIDVSHLVLDGSTALAVGAQVPTPDVWSQPTGMPQWEVLRFDPATLGWTPAGPSFDAQWATVASDGGTVSLVVLPELNAPLTAYELRPEGWHIAATSDVATQTLRTIEIDGYPPVALWTGEEHLVGGTRGLVAWGPGDDEFRMVVDRRLSVFGGTAVWTGEQAVALTNQETEGWTFTPAPARAG